MNLNSVQTTTIDIARRAGDVLMRHFEGPIQEETKTNAYDVVTQADKAAEAVIVAALCEAFPDHHIVGEEGGGMGAPADTAGYFWYVDPLDGTSNFANGLPFFCVSMALADRDKRPLVGVVYSPTNGECACAVRGHGATLNGKPMHVSRRDSLQTSLLVTGFPYDRASTPDNNMSEWMAFDPLVRGLRRFGSAALELCWVAAGRFDGYWEMRINAWDCLAGILCVEEAGGQVSDYEGQKSEKLYSGQRIVASNGLIHAQMLSVLADARNRTAQQDL